MGASGLATRAPWCRSLRTCRRARYLAVRARRQFAAGRGRSLPDHARSVRCRNCAAIFSLCSRCDRGQVCCSRACRAQRRRAQRRAADARYRASPEARADARDRQRAFRDRRRAAGTVTGHGSDAASAAGTVLARTDEAPCSVVRTEVARVHNSTSIAAIVLACCAICAQPVRFRIARPDRPRAFAASFACPIDARHSRAVRLHDRHR